MLPDELLLRKASTAAHDGWLPRRAPDRTWGGHGIGLPCAVCEVPITKEEMELEVEVAQDGGVTPDPATFHLHPRCFFSAWDFERKQESV
jgi:hypothetical protein